MNDDEWWWMMINGECWNKSIHGKELVQNNSSIVFKKVGPLVNSADMDYLYNTLLAIHRQFYQSIPSTVVGVHINVSITSIA